MNIGCGDRRQTFRLDFARTFAIVSKASATNLQRQGRRSDDFISDTGGEGSCTRYEPAQKHFQIVAGSHFSKTVSWLGSMLVKAILIPVSGMTDMTQPNAVNVVFL
jgi:hypothetical protein